MSGLASRFMAAVLLGLAFLAASTARGSDFAAMRTRWQEMLTLGTNAVFSDPLYAPWITSLESSANSYRASMNTNPFRTNLWTDLREPGTDSSDISGSYNRLRTMALAHSVHGSSLRDNAAVRAAVLDGLDWLNTHHYNETNLIYDNWFDFSIAAPLALNDTVVLMHPYLSAAQIDRYMRAVDHFTPTPDLTAANKVWKALVVALRGVIVGDSNKIGIASMALSDVFPNVTTGDGFYADGSFIFHNYIPYNGGYGVDLLHTITPLMQLLEGSPWQVTNPLRTNLFRWVYDSFEPFLVSGAMMQMVDGRYHTRTGDDHAEGHDLLAAMLRLAEIAPAADAAAYRSFVKGAILADTYRDFVSREQPPYNVWANAVRNDSTIPANKPLPEHRQFSMMDRVVHRRPNWTFGLAMNSSRVANYESTRGENLKGWFTSEGMTYLYNSDLGHYADQFWPTVDPYRLPGTTVDVGFRADGSGDAKRSPNAHTGGATLDGVYGVAAMHLNAWNSMLSARKSWFMFDDEIVCVGNSVSTTGSNVVETIVENRRLGVYGDNAFVVNGTGKPASPGWSETIASTTWAHLAGTTAGADIGYYFPQPTAVKALRESRAGSMRDLNTSYGSSTRHTRHYLTLYLDHGLSPSNGTYAYVLRPGASMASMEAYAANPDVVIVENTSRTTAVREKTLGIMAVNFWRDASNHVAGISADRKASVITRNDGHVLKIAVSDPTQTNTGIIRLDLTNAATQVLRCDPEITVEQLSPTIRLAVDARGKLGASLAAEFAVTPITTVSLPAVMDAYVQDGTNSDTNFGLVSFLRVKATGANQVRESFLQFDLGGINGEVIQAELRLTPTTLDDPLFHALSPVADDGWTDTSITWNNKPAHGPEHTRWQLTNGVGTPVLVPVTELARQAASTDRRLSVRIASTGIPVPTNGGFVAYGSANNGTPGNQPRLIVQFRRTPPVVSLALQGDTQADAPATATLIAAASDSDGAVTNIDLFSSTGRIAQATTHTTISGLPEGTYTFTAVATDNSGLSSTSAPVILTVYPPEPAGRGTGLIGEYFADRNLTAYVTNRLDSNINFAWGSGAGGSPAPGVPADGFSIRWSGLLQAQHAGEHRFHTVSDEGVRLWIDGRLVIDNWAAHNVPIEDTGSIDLLPGRYYRITLEYYDHSFSATARLYWTPPGGNKEIVPTAQLYPSGEGLRATYYANVNLSNPVLTRRDSEIRFDWGTTTPEPNLLEGAFSARWTGKVRTESAGTHTFITTSANGVRLWVNGTQLINHWTAHSRVENSSSIHLEAAQYYDLTMEYFSTGGAAVALLEWIPPGKQREPVPASHLTPWAQNRPPVLAPVAPIRAPINATVTFNVSATDPDSPGQTLQYSLDPGSPAGATIDPNTGLVSLLATSQTPGLPGVDASAFNLIIRVSDSGTPQMTDAITVPIQIDTQVAAVAVPLVSAQSTWRYLDTGIYPGAAWSTLTYNAAGWKSGTSSFGYGLGVETSVISYGLNANEKPITTWFRVPFVVPDASLVRSLSASLACDDGAVIYINGTEVHRENLPTGSISATTRALIEITGAAQTNTTRRALAPGTLRTGTNILSVELHQASPQTPDAHLNLQLFAEAIVPSAPEVLFTTAGGELVARWPAEGAFLRAQVATNLVPPIKWMPLSTEPNLHEGRWQLVLPTNNPTLFLRLQAP